ncbi:putative Xanthine dehydrogenase [Quillaja saponaria]|uniref:xanthine dehydrogenase n=1 Tax=Quillaja saponaria TaxID=32244 RepID=A0AAD7QFW9_QUISA|nr:putative Xanthine dehydrogenase [Quillaja saponaria]
MGESSLESSLKKKQKEPEKMVESTEAIIYVNGVRRVLPDGLAHLTLLEYLRGSSAFETSFRHYAINACLAPLYSVEGMHVITVEGLGNCKRGLHPIQESLAQSHGTQCGFCTPGFVMSMYALLRSNQTPPNEVQIEECLAGNLCRCTGYRPILDAFRVFAKTNDIPYTGISSASIQGNSIICPSTGKPCSCGSENVSDIHNNKERITSNDNRYEPVSYNDVDGSKYIEKELIFPPELLLRKSSSLTLNGFGGLKWYRPLSLQDVLDLKAKHPDAKLLVGNTEVGIETRLKKMQYPVLMSVVDVPEFNVLSVKHEGIEIGAAVRLSNLMKFFSKIITERAAHETSSCQAFLEQLKWFAGTQIRNVASVGGNICTASPISDLNPLWMATRAEFRIIDCNGNIRTTMAEDFFLGYRKVDLTSSEILLSVFLPWTKTFEFVKEFKQAHRRDDDIAIVNAGMRVDLEEDKNGNWVVADSSIVYGGVAPISVSATKTKEFLIGKIWNKDILLHNALELLLNDISLKQDAPGGMVEFRKSLTLSFFFKFFLWVSHQIVGEKFIENCFPSSYPSAIQTSFHRPTVTGSQDYEITKHGTAVGSPEVHLSSRLQVTGEAEYVGDTPLAPNGLHAALVLSSKPHARILSINDSGAKLSPGFVGIFLAKDVPGDNKLGPVIADEELFATEFVTCVGQVIGVVVADTHENAKLAARKVHVDYEELPAIFSIQDAINARSFHPNTERRLEKGNVDLCFQSAQCDKIIEGEVQIGGQEHFYLEPHGTLIWTVDSGNEVHMISSTQHPQNHQMYVSHVLGLPMSKVVCKTKRVGGAFGGKETRSAFLAAAASVPSYLLDRAVKIILDRNIDMMITGQRHSFLGKYKVGFTNEGKVIALDLEIYNNGGNSLDLSHAILERAMFHSDNVYEIPNVRILGRVCFTNLPSNTAFRGFGGPQGMLIAENWIERIASELKKRPEEIRELNFQGEGSILHYGQQLQHCTLAQLWDELKLSSDFLKACLEVDRFNSHNRWRKRGVAMVPTKFGISFQVKLLNQAGALVHVYTDGTVLITHGGVEMGQGLHTKVAQIAASAFNIPLHAVFISETSTDKIPNASATAASASSDMYGAAVLDACDQLKARMEPVALQHNFNSFAEISSIQISSEAFMLYSWQVHVMWKRIDLSARGFYVPPYPGFDWETGKGKPFRYFTYGAAFAEVEIDTLTGDFHTRAVNIIMDLGFSLNPAVDIGQIEGAFMQGLGWVALEELKRGDGAHKWIPPGCLFTCGPGSYKIPSANDVPFKFDVSLLKGHPNAEAIHSSKAVGEPPFFLASAVFFAIKDAIRAARAEVETNDWFPLDNPATPERIRMACLDEFTTFVSSDFRPNLSI